MSNFGFQKAKNVEEATALLAEYKDKAVLVAGGTNVMPNIYARKLDNVMLISIRDIEEMKGITYEDGLITVGALTTIYEIGKSEIIKEHAAALYMAAQVFADPTTCHTATIGGNNANASPDADTAAPLIALDAVVNVKSASSERAIPIDEFYLGVRETCLAPDELIVSFSFRPAKSAYYKIGSRKSMSVSLAGAAAAVELDPDGAVKYIRIGMGAVAPKTIRCTNAEKAMLGKKLTEEAFEEMGKALQDDIDPWEGNIRASQQYLRDVSPVCVKRAIRLACYGKCSA